MSLSCRTDSCLAINLVTFEVSGSAQKFSLVWLPVLFAQVIAYGNVSVCFGFPDLCLSTLVIKSWDTRVLGVLGKQ